MSAAAERQASQAHAEGPEPSQGGPLLRRLWPYLGPLALFMGFSLLHMMGVAPLRPVDERSHTAYAMSVAEGELPTVATPIDTEKLGASRRSHARDHIWVANHPPLYYWAAATVMHPELDRPAHAVRRARVLSLGCALAALCLLSATLWELTRNRALALLAPALCAGVPALVHICSLVHNDSAAWLSVAALFYICARMAKRGVTVSRVSWYALLCGIAMLTRVSGILALACTGLWLSVIILREHERPFASRLKRLGAVALSSITVTCLFCAWFYLRNYELYGDLTGSNFLLTMFGRHSHGELLDLIATPKKYTVLFSGVWNRFARGHVVRGAGLLASALTYAVIVAHLWHLIRWWRQRPRTMLPRATLEFYVASGLCFVLLIFAAFQFHSKGANLHSRYLFTGMWCVTIMLAIPLVRAPIVAAISLLGLCFNHFLTISSYTEGALRNPAAYQRVRTNIFELAATQHGFEHPRLLSLLAVVLIAIGLAFTLHGLLTPESHRSEQR